MSQGSYAVPTGGSMSATTFAGLCNSAWLALASKNSGSSAPANGPNSVATQFQDWMDTTTALFPVWKIYDGVNFPKLGRLDVANSIWCPQVGGGLSSIASAATVNLGAQIGSLVTITGVAAISSFGSAPVNGEEKKVYCGGAFTLVNGANLVCPGGSNIIVTAGDIFTAIYDGAGVWLIYGYQRTSAAAGTNLPSGAHFWMYQTGTLAGAVRANGNTIGNTGSGATEATGASVQTLFTLIWNQSNAVSDPEITFQDSTGAGAVRGVSAAADFTALKRMTLPDLRGRVPFGLDGMGNIIGNAGRMTSTTMSPDGNTLGAVGGSQSVTLSTSTMPSHNHTGTTSADSGHTHTVPNVQPGTPVVVNNGVASNVVGFASSSNTSSNSAVITTTVASQGGGGAHLNAQPSKGGTWYMAL